MSTSHFLFTFEQLSPMKNSVSPWWLLAFTALLAYACDIINKDGKLQPITPEPAGTVLYTTPKNGLVMNLLTMDEYKNATGFQIASQPKSGRVSFVKEGTLLYTPDTTKNVRSDYFVLRVSTGDTAKNTPKTDTIRIKFVPRDSIPCRLGVIADGYVTQPNTRLVMNVLENDYFCQGTVDSTSLQITKRTEHGNLTLRSDRRIVYVPDANYVGYDYFLYKVCNNKGECGEAPVKILVQKRDSSDYCPGAQPDSYSFRQDSTISHVLNLFANDRFCPDSADYASFSLVSLPKHGTVQIGRSLPPVITYRHNYGFSGIDSFRYRICTRSGKCTEADVKITIEPCNIALVGDTLRYKVNGSTDSLYSKGTSLNILQNDNLSCPVTAIYEITITKQPRHGTARAFGNLLIYKANPGFKGQDTVEYGLCVIGNSQSCVQRAPIYIDIR